MDHRQLAAALDAAGVDPRTYRIAGLPQLADQEPAEGAVLLTGSARSGRWYLKGGQEVVPGWPAVLREFETEQDACQYLYDELTRTDRPPLAAEKAAWAVAAERLRAEAEARLAAEHPARAAERARWAAEWDSRRAQGRPLMDRAELVAALAAAGTDEPYWIDRSAPEPAELPDLDADDEDWPESEPWPADCFLLAWDGLDCRWVTGSRPAGGQLSEHLVFPADAEDEACVYVFEYLTSPPLPVKRMTREQWRALRRY